MDREDIFDRLAFDQIPGVGSGEDTETEPPDSFDEAIEDPEESTDEGVDSPTDEGVDSPTDEVVGAPIDEAFEAPISEPIEPEKRPSRREQARKLLLGMSLGGAGLAVLAAVLRRWLGSSDDDGDDGDAVEGDEPHPGQPEDAGLEEAEGDGDVSKKSDVPAPDAEAVAAVIGLGFQLLVRALVGEDESETSTG